MWNLVLFSFNPGEYRPHAIWRGVEGRSRHHNLGLFAHNLPLLSFFIKYSKKADRGWICMRLCKTLGLILFNSWAQYSVVDPVSFLLLTFFAKLQVAMMVWYNFLSSQLVYITLGYERSERSNAGKMVLKWQVNEFHTHKTVEISLPL